jgi:hypothetical protein
MEKINKYFNEPLGGIYTTSGAANDSGGVWPNTTHPAKTRGNSKKNLTLSCEPPIHRGMIQLYRLNDIHEIKTLFYG